MSETSSKKRKLSLPLVIAGGVSSLVLAFGMSPTFSAFTASIINNDTAVTGKLIMTEVSGTFTCNSSDVSLSSNSATCANINKYGGTAMVPGIGVATQVSIQNTGTVAASAFTLAFGACAHPVLVPGPNGTATDLCDKMLVEVKMANSPFTLVTAAGSTATTLASTSINVRTALGLGPIVGSSPAIPLVVTVTLPTQGTNALDNTYQGLQIQQSMTWNFQS
jgi:hypothetical protein